LESTKSQGSTNIWTKLLCFGIDLSALAAGFLGLFSMLACGASEVGRISVSGRVLPKVVPRQSAFRSIWRRG
jgi:hypothetical protein